MELMFRRNDIEYEMFVPNKEIRIKISNLETSLPEIEMVDAVKKIAFISIRNFKELFYSNQKLKNFVRILI